MRVYSNTWGVGAIWGCMGIYRGLVRSGCEGGQ